MPATRRSRRSFAIACQHATVLAATAAVAFSALGVVELDIVAPAGPGTAAAGDAAPAQLVSTAPVRATVREVPLGGAVASGMRAPGTRSGPAGTEPRVVLRSQPERAPGYATVGVTWDGGQQVTEDDLEVEVRTRVDGVWSAWGEMHHDPEHAPDPGEGTDLRSGTDAVVVGDVDRVQVRLLASGRTPAGLELAVIDPGEDAAAELEEPAIPGAGASRAGEPGSAPRADGATSADGAVTAAAAAPARPAIFSREQWGADESLRDGSPRYGAIRGAFVHHTVNANNYSRDDVRGILRSIYAYHTRSLGWSDIGYNFLVDRFGRIWEGRYGGVDRPVVGAHTLGYNEESFAMSAIGNFETAQPTRAMLDAYERLFAWKLSMYDIAGDDTRVTIAGDAFQAISGHRDAGSTACPGRYLYAQLDTIRRGTAALQRGGGGSAPARAPELNTDISGKGGWPDLVARDRRSGHALVVRTGGQLAFLESTSAAPDLGATDLVAAPGDLDGDRDGDVLTRDAASGRTTVWRGNADTGRFTAVRRLDRFAPLDRLAAGGDLDGDGDNDLVGRVGQGADRGRLLLYPGTGDGGFERARRLAADWSRYDLVAGVGDFDSDGNDDLLARDGAALFLVPGDGQGGLRAPVRVAGDWSGMDLLAGRGDVTRDGNPDLVARVAATGTTYVVPGDGRGGVGPRLGGTQRFASVRWLALGGQVVGTRAADLVAIGGKGGLRVVRNSGGTNVPKVTDTGVDLSRADLVVSVGDWDGDRRGDFVERRRSGAVFLHRGRGDDTFRAPVRMATGWEDLDLVAAVGDLTGDGHADLVTATRGGAVQVRPGDGATGIGGPSGVGGSVTPDRLAGVGFWNADRVPDLVARRPDGSLWLHRADAPGRLSAGSRLGTADGYDVLLGLGDLDGRGKADLLAREAASGDLWLLRGRAQGFAPRRLVAPGFDRYDLLG